VPQFAGSGRPGCAHRAHHDPGAHPLNGDGLRGLWAAPVVSDARVLLIGQSVALMSDVGSGERWTPHSTSSGSGPRVVLVHGQMTTSQQSWKYQQVLAERWTVTLVDRRGYAPNPIAEDCDFEVDAADLELLLDSPAHLVGHSYGALAVMFAAAHRPETVRSLTVIEAPTVSLVRGESIIEERINLNRAGRLLNDPVEVYRALLKRIGAPTDTVSDPLPEAIERQVRLHINERPAWEARLPMKALASADFPKLIVSGGWDPVWEMASDALAAQLGSNARRLVMPGGGHVVQRREAFNPALEDFFSGAERR
jgi:pimeloyl-ACP methyl ester carboxylesterase